MEPEDLYGLPLERFTEERNGLAKALRGEGRREQAAEVSKLRKPSVAAWAVNQLVRTQRREIDQLFAAGDTLQRAQSDLLSRKGNPSALREAAEAERAAVDELIDAARGLTGSDGRGLSATTLEPVSETLHAGALDADARGQLRTGCLDRELHHVGLGGVGAASGRPPGAGKRSKGASAATPSRGGPRSGGRQEPSRAAQERATRLRAAHKLEAQTRRERDRAARALKDAEQRRDRAAAALHDAEVTLDEARESAAAAELAHQRADRAIDGP